MKIFFFIPSLEKGGIERSLSRISRKLIDLGWDVTLLTNELSIEGKSYFETSIKIIKVDDKIAAKLFERAKPIIGNKNKNSSK